MYWKCFLRVVEAVVASLRPASAHPQSRPWGTILEFLDVHTSHCGDHRERNCIDVESWVHLQVVAECAVVCARGAQVNEIASYDIRMAVRRVRPEPENALECETPGMGTVAPDRDSSTGAVQATSESHVSDLGSCDHGQR